MSGAFKIVAILCMVLLVLFAVGCSAGTEGSEEQEPDVVAPPVGKPQPERPVWDEAARMRPDLMRVEPESAVAGATVNLHFPQGTERGVAFVLERRRGDRWMLRYYLTADPEHPGWAPADEDYGWDAIGLEGPGPDLVVVPPVAEPGAYRICTANAGTNFCTPLWVTEAG